MIDRSFTAPAQLLRSPDLRLSDVETRVVEVGSRSPVELSAAGRSMFVYILSGTVECQDATSGDPPRRLESGTAVGIEDGRQIGWRTVGGEPGIQALLFVSSIPRRIAILQRLTGGIIVVPPTAEPFAATLRAAVDMHRTQVAYRPDARNDPVVNRCAEICLIQFIEFARAGLAARSPAPASIAHDEQLLAAWTAYFADPRRRWTVGALADAAGMGRTAFSQRFRIASGAPPLQTLTALRLEQAEAMLRDGRTALIEIAFTVGYNSEAAFVRAFQRHFGITPGRFRTRELAQERGRPADNSSMT